MRKLFLTFLITMFCLSLASLSFANEKGGFSSVKDAQKDIKGPPATVKASLDCSGATPVTFGTLIFGDTTGGVNNVSTYGCSTYDESGPEVVFVLTLTEPTMFHVDLTPAFGIDLDLAAIDGCDEDLGCLIVADSGIVTNAPATGTIYFVVDGYNGDFGPFELLFTQDPIPDPVDACAEVIQPLPGNEGDVVPPGNYSFSGDTCGSTNHIEFLDCGGYPEAGLDNFYEFTLLPGASIDVSVTSSTDGALWILDACQEPFGCLGYADASYTGEAETVAYSNATGSQQTVFLVVDSYSFSGGGCGTFTGEITVNGGVVGVEVPSWGALKTRF